MSVAVKFGIITFTAILTLVMFQLEMKPFNMNLKLDSLVKHFVADFTAVLQFLLMNGSHVNIKLGLSNKICWTLRAWNVSQVPMNSFHMQAESLTSEKLPVTFLAFKQSDLVVDF